MVENVLTHDTFNDENVLTHDTFNDENVLTHDTFNDENVLTRDTFDDRNLSNVSEFNSLLVTDARLHNCAQLAQDLSSVLKVNIPDWRITQSNINEVFENTMKKIKSVYKTMKPSLKRKIVEVLCARSR